MIVSLILDTARHTSRGRAARWARVGCASVARCPVGIRGLDNRVHLYIQWDRVKLEWDPKKAASKLDSFGRVLVVCYTWRGERIRIISVRKAAPSEQRQYEEGL